MAWLVPTSEARQERAFAKYGAPARRRTVAFWTETGAVLRAEIRAALAAAKAPPTGTIAQARREARAERVANSGAALLANQDRLPIAVADQKQSANRARMAAQVSAITDALGEELAGKISPSVWYRLPRFAKWADLADDYLIDATDLANIAQAAADGNWQRVFGAKKRKPASRVLPASIGAYLRSIADEHGRRDLAAAIGAGLAPSDMLVVLLGFGAALPDGARNATRTALQAVVDQIQPKPAPAAAVATVATAPHELVAA